MQELLKLINCNAKTRQEKVINARHVLSAFPKSSLFSEAIHMHYDIAHFCDNGIYDLLLHAQDRAYTIEELFEDIAREKLHFVRFGQIEESAMNISNYGLSPEIIKIISDFDELRQYRIC